MPQTFTIFPSTIHKPEIIRYRCTNTYPNCIHSRRNITFFRIKKRIRRFVTLFSTGIPYKLGSRWTDNKIKSCGCHPKDKMHNNLSFL